ncbi:MAG: hypothetical protein LIP03_01115 [Bacteroidales bacterium]|nr:hypothetical protein [Bacteroidales bacterium]
MRHINIQHIAFTVAVSTSILATAGCSTKKDAPLVTEASSSEVTQTLQRQSASYIPKAVIYKTNGDYNDNVPITLSADGKSVVSFPAPTDLRENSTPLPVGNGWLLDRRGGIGINTAFLTYTYSQYRDLAQAPSVTQLLDSVIPGARVVETKTLPITYSQAISDPSLVEQYAK